MKVPPVLCYNKIMNPVNLTKNTKSFKILRSQIVELVEDQEFCDEDNEHQDEQLLDLVEDVTNVIIVRSDPKIKEFLKEIGWGISEFYNSEYASEAPGSRSSHRSGYKESMKKSKVLIREFFSTLVPVDKT